MKFLATLPFVFADAGSWLRQGFGELDGLVYALIAFVAIDYITGVMCAVADKTLSSDVGFRGIFKKIMIFVMVAVGHMIDTQIVPAAITGGYPAVRTAIILFYLANEGLSLLENSTRLGLPVPQKLKDILAKLHEKGDSNEAE